MSPLFSKFLSNIMQLQSILYQSKLMHVQFGKRLLERFYKKRGGMSEEIYILYYVTVIKYSLSTLIFDKAF